ncbi:ankyrin repeat-containing domain protein [Haematococcus lacustris]
MVVSLDKPIAFTGASHIAGSFIRAVSSSVAHRSLPAANHFRTCPTSRVPSMERTPWWSTINASKLQPWDGKAVGVKPDGGGSIRGQGRVGPMRLHRAAHNRNAEAIKACIASGDDVNEVEAAGNTPLHAAAYEGWDEGVQLLLSLGAKVNASNNAGDTPWHTASHVGNDSTMQLLEQAGASKVQGKVLVQENIPKVSDFYQKECWAHHPLPYADYVEYKRKERDAWEEQRRRNRMIESTS